MREATHQTRTSLKQIPKQLSIWVWINIRKKHTQKEKKKIFRINRKKEKRKGFWLVVSEEGCEGRCKGQRKRKDWSFEWIEENPEKEEKEWEQRILRKMVPMRERENLLFQLFWFYRMVRSAERSQSQMRSLSLSLWGDICFSWQLATNSQQPMRLSYVYTLTYTIFKISSIIQYIYIYIYIYISIFNL